MRQDDMLRRERSRDSFTFEAILDDRSGRTFHARQRVLDLGILAVEVVAIALVAEISPCDSPPRGDIVNPDALFIFGEIPEIKFGDKVMLFVVWHNWKPESLSY